MHKRVRIILKRLSKRHKIKVIYKFKGLSGTAFHNRRAVNIPKNIDSAEKALTALHEIGHIVNGDRSPRYYDEYLAERFAIRTAKLYGIVCDDYEFGAKCYVMWFICDDLKKKNISLNKIKPSVIRFVSDVFDFDDFKKRLKKGYSPHDYSCDQKKFKTKWRKKSAKSIRRSKETC